MDGYAGKFLDVDLSTRRAQDYIPEEKVLKDYLSGIGISTKILYDQIPPGADPLGPENVLVFSTGVFSGTNIPTACRTEASAKSPATGLFGSANSGNYWGSELKYAGYDGLIIRGKAQTPVYIWIKNGRVDILDASGLWGKDAWDTLKEIRAAHGDEEIQAALIGQAGENLVRFASIENGPYDAWARTGLGAVMGSKNLKAVAVRGTGGVKVARKKEFLQAVSDTREAIYGSPFYGAFSRFGTMLVTLPYQEFGALPGRNFQTGVIPGWVETRSRKLVPKYSNRGVACISCPIACAHWTEVKEGPYKGLSIKDMEVTPVIGFGAGCDISNLPAIAKLTEVCQRYGMDMVSAAAAVAFAMEMNQRGLIKDDELGFSLPWGSEEATFLLLGMIAGRDGIGDLLAEGTRRAAEKIPGAEKYAAHVKGLEPFLIDPRSRWSTWTLGYLTSTRGGDHLRTRNPLENLRHNENPVPYMTEKFDFPDEMYHTFDMPDAMKEEIFDPVTKDVSIPKMSKWSEDLINVYNATGICIRPPVLHTVGPTLISRLYSSLTGIDLTPGEVMKAGERAWNLQKLFNIKHGESREDLDFPKRFYEEPQGTGPAKGRTLDRRSVKKALEDYFEARGWDRETGVPMREKLQELGLQ